MKIETVQENKNKECPNCVGRGWRGAYSIHKTCHTCNGTGSLPAKKNSRY